MTVRAVLLSAAALLAGLGAGALSRWPAVIAPAVADPPAGFPAELPLPPIPPRIEQSAHYEACLSAIANDPVAAISASTTWPGDGALHCRALAMVAQGDLAGGAALLETLAARTAAPAVARAAVDGQASRAWLLAGQPSRALSAAAAAIALSPDDPDNLIDHAAAAARLDQTQTALDDLDQAIDLDPSRADALSLRAAAWRRLGQPDLAADDATRAHAVDPGGE